MISCTDPKACADLICQDIESTYSIYLTPNGSIMNGQVDIIHTNPIHVITLKLFETGDVSPIQNITAKQIATMPSTTSVPSLKIIPNASPP